MSIGWFKDVFFSPPLDEDFNEREELPPSEEDIPQAPLSLWAQRQIWLQLVGEDPGPVDGIVGRRTESAIRSFQKNQGLRVDGIWGPFTQAAMEKELDQLGSPVSPAIPPAPLWGYEDLLEEEGFELDEDFWTSFEDLTGKTSKSLHKGTRQLENLRRLCWHQTAFTWRPYREAAGRYTSHHKINAHICIDTDGTILLLHEFKHYLWTANAFNKDCISIEVMGNFEGELGTGNWFKPDKFGRARPTRIQLIRARQLTFWLLYPNQGPEKVPGALEVWRQFAKDRSPIIWNNAHRQATDDRPLDCGSECWYHIVRWGVDKFKEEFSIGPEAGKGQKIPDVWNDRPAVPPLPF